MQEPTHPTDWPARAEALAIDPRAAIGGRRVTAHSQTTFEVVDPQSGRLLARVPACAEADVDAAVEAARRAFDDGRWSDLSPWERGRALLRFADAVEHHAEELALLDSLQMGMPVAQAVPDLQGAADAMRACAELADKLPDQAVPSAASALALNLRLPHGVVGAVTPWNFPVYVALGKVVPALAAGNTVVIKPSEVAPLAVLRLADLAIEAGLPAGVVNVVPGLGGQAGRALALHPEVDCISFTGSTATGRLLLAYAGQSNMKSMLLECGGKSPQIVFDDLGDIDALAAALVQGFTWNSGQVCVAGTRILVARPLHDRLLAAMAAQVAGCATGAPLDPATSLGPLANRTHADSVRRFIDTAGPDARLVAQGRAAAGACHVAPVLFAAAPTNSPLVQEEIFGPVAVVQPFEDAAGALALANATRYGLSATVWTRDVPLAQRLVRRLRSGFTVVNTVPDPRPAHAGLSAGEPVGLSGFGVEGGAGGILAYTRQRSVTFHFG